MMYLNLVTCNHIIGYSLFLVHFYYYNTSNYAMSKFFISLVSEIQIIILIKKSLIIIGCIYSWKNFSVTFILWKSFLLIWFEYNFMFFYKACHEGCGGLWGLSFPDDLQHLGFKKTNSVASSTVILSRVLLSSSETFDSLMVRDMT